MAGQSKRGTQAGRFTRTVWLTDDEFEALHGADQSHPPDVDRQPRVDDLDEIAQPAAVEAQWVHARAR